MNNRKVLYAIVALIVILLVAWSLSTATPGGSNLSYIERASGIDIPASVTNVSVYNDAAYVTAHFTVPAAEIASFASANGFKAQRLTNNLMGMNNLDAQYRSLTKAANSIVQGQNDDNRWLFLLDKTTGDVWTTVYR